jgi:hypothetical protein
MLGGLVPTVNKEFLVALYFKSYFGRRKGLTFHRAWLKITSWNFATTLIEKERFARRYDNFAAPGQ